MEILEIEDAAQRLARNINALAFLENGGDDKDASFGMALTKGEVACNTALTLRH